MDAHNAESVRDCGCIPVPGTTWHVTTYCLLHNPFERMERGEAVEFVGLRALLNDEKASD